MQRALGINTGCAYWYLIDLVHSVLSECVLLRLWLAMKRHYWMDCWSIIATIIGGLKVYLNA